MALSKPVLNPIGAWDVTVGATFTFNVIGGDQVEGNRLTICEQTDLENPVYQESVASYDYAHIVSENAPNLTNGVYYVAYVQTYRTVGGVVTYSAKSDPLIQFDCYATPQFEFTNIDEGDTVNSSEYEFTAFYKQAIGRDLLTYKFNLYNEQGALIKTSGLLYGANLTKKYATTPSPDYDWYYDISYVVQGLENSTPTHTSKYYIEMVGTSYGNMQLTTGRIQFIVNYQGEIESVLIKAENKCADGNILITSSLDVMNGVAEREPIYIDDKEIDLRGGVELGRLPNTVTWDELDDQTDLSIRIVFRAPITLGGDRWNVKLMDFEDGSDVGGLYYYYEEANQESMCRFYFQDYSPYLVETSTFVGIPNDHIKYVVVIKRISGVWSIAWDVYDYPSGTLYVEGDNAYISILNVKDEDEPLTTNTTYTYDEDTGELTADAPDNYDFDYEADGDIILTI